jgi:uncharacterized RDD family membrane protein YckC
VSTDQEGRDPNEAPAPPAQDWQSQPQQPAPPAQDWQSQPQQPAPPPSGGTETPAWVGNLTSTAPVAGPAGYFYADVPNRAIAYIIDAIIIGIVGIILSAIFLVGSGFDTGSLLLVAVIGLAINAAYFMYTWVAMRGTVGMKLLGMQIGHESDGRTLTYNEAAVRWVLLGAPFGLAQLLNTWPGLGLIISLLGFVWLIALLVTTAQSPTKQGLHDRYAHTMVVKAARSVA